MLFSCLIHAHHPCAGAEKINGSLVKAAWVEFICTMLFIYIATGTICFGCHSYALAMPDCLPQSTWHLLAVGSSSQWSLAGRSPCTWHV